jgi:hypothetical protein
MSKFLATVFVLSALIGLGVLVMMYGWGLEVKSWPWVIGGGVFGQAFLKIIGDKVISE